MKKWISNRFVVLAVIVVAMFGALIVQMGAFKSKKSMAISPCPLWVVYIRVKHT